MKNKTDKAPALRCEAMVSPVLNLSWPSDILVTLGRVNPKTGWREDCEVSDGLHRISFKYDHGMDLQLKTQEVLNEYISRLRSFAANARGVTDAPITPKE